MQQHSSEKGVWDCNLWLLWFHVSKTENKHFYEEDLEIVANWYAPSRTHWWVECNIKSWHPPWSWAERSSGPRRSWRRWAAPRRRCWWGTRRCLASGGMARAGWRPGRPWRRWCRSGSRRHWACPCPVIGERQTGKIYLNEYICMWECIGVCVRACSYVCVTFALD